MLAPMHGFYLAEPAWVDHSLATTAEAIAEVTTGRAVCTFRLPDGLVAHAYRRGFFGLDFRAWPPGRAEPQPLASDPRYADVAHYAEALIEARLNRARALNAFQACIHSALQARQQHSHKKMALTPTTLVTGYVDDPAHLTAIHWLFGPDGGDFVIECATVEMAAQIFAGVLVQQDAYLLTALDLYMRSMAELQDHNYAFGLTIAWTVAETLLFRALRAYVAAGQHRGEDVLAVPYLAAKPRAAFRKGRGDAKEVIDFLGGAGLLPPKLAQEAHAMREARNGWLHRLEPIERAEGARAVHLVEALLGTLEQVELRALLTSAVSTP